MTFSTIFLFRKFILFQETVCSDFKHAFAAQTLYSLYIKCKHPHFFQAFKSIPYLTCINNLSTKNWNTDMGGGEGVGIVGCVSTLLKRTARWRWTCFRIPPNKIKSVLPIHCITVELKLKGFSSFLFLLILVSCNQLAICLAWFLPAALGPPKVVNDELVPLLANQAARLQSTQAKENFYSWEIQSSLLFTWSN